MLLDLLVLICGRFCDPHGMDWCDQDNAFLNEETARFVFADLGIAKLVFATHHVDARPVNITVEGTSLSCHETYTALIDEDRIHITTDGDIRLFIQEKNLPGAGISAAHNLSE